MRNAEKNTETDGQHTACADHGGDDVLHRRRVAAVPACLGDDLLVGVFVAERVYRCARDVLPDAEFGQCDDRAVLYQQHAVRHDGVACGDSQLDERKHLFQQIERHGDRPDVFDRRHEYPECGIDCEFQRQDGVERRARYGRAHGRHARDRVGLLVQDQRRAGGVPCLHHGVPPEPQRNGRRCLWLRQ